MPLWVRKFIVDAVETGGAALLVLTFAGDAASLGHAALAAGAGALLSAARREFPDAIAWLKDKLGVS